MASGKRNTPESIASRLVPQDDCLVWTGQTWKGGYGAVSYNGKKRLVHRILWEAENGEVPEGYELHHTCHVTACANLEHIQVVTPKENCADRDTTNMVWNNPANKAQPECIREHEQGCWYSRPNGDSGYCKQRHKEYKRKYNGS